VEYVRPFLVIALIIGGGVPFGVVELDRIRLVQELQLMPELVATNGPLNASALASEAVRLAELHKFTVAPDSVRVTVGDSHGGSPRFRSGVFAANEEGAQSTQVQNVSIEIDVDALVYGKLKRRFELRVETVGSGRGPSSRYP
jgi:hypothetical protein